MLFSKSVFESMISFHIGKKAAADITYEEYQDLSRLISAIMDRLVASSKNNIPDIPKNIDRILDIYELEINEEKITNHVYLFATNELGDWSIMANGIANLGFPNLNFLYGAYLVTYQWYILDYFARKIAVKINLEKTFPKNRRSLLSIKDLVKAVTKIDF